MASGPRKAVPEVKVRIRPPYGNEYVATMAEAAEAFGTNEATVKAWCIGKANAPFHYSVRYETGYVPAMTDDQWRMPMSAPARSMYMAMKERRRRELDE